MFFNVEQARILKNYVEANFAAPANDNELKAEKEGLSRQEADKFYQKLSNEISLARGFGGPWELQIAY